MATAMFAESLDNSQHTVRINPESNKLNPSHEYPRARYLPYPVS
jgi:hypothetical protein